MRRLAAGTSLMLLLSACEPVTPIEVDVQGAIHTGSGIVRDVTKGVVDTVEFGKQAAEKVEAGLTEAQKRAQQVQEGLRKIEEGRAELRKGIIGE